MTTFHDQIKDKQPVAKFEQQTRSNQSDIQFITNLNSFLSIIPLISSANAQGHPGMDRSWAILNLHEDQSNENHISIKYSPKKKARVFVVICQATINTTIRAVGLRVGTSVMCGFHGFHGCVSKNEILRQIFSSKLEVIDQKSSKVPLRK